MTDSLLVQLRKGVLDLCVLALLHAGTLEVDAFELALVEFVEGGIGGIGELVEGAFLEAGVVHHHLEHCLVPLAQEARRIRLKSGPKAHLDVIERRA